jgi:general secretion pathway protein K
MQNRISSFDYQGHPESPDLNPAFASSTLTSRRDKRDAGVALLAVMSAVAVLILVALAFSGSVQIETRAAIYRKEATQAYALATGGVQAAILEIAYPPADDQKDKPRLWRRGQRLVRVPYDHGRAVVEIVNENGKLDLNFAGQKQLARLFGARGLNPADATQLAMAINDWRSPPGSDDRESAALEDYYREAGYRPAHDRFRSLEEVLRVRGMSRDVFYGTAEFSRQAGIQYQYGVGQDLTIYSKSTQVNVNYASEAVLLSVPGMGESLAQSIVQERSNKPFKSLDDMAQRLAISLPDEAVSFLTTDEAGIYSIVSVGEVNDSKVRRTVEAVVQVLAQGVAQGAAQDTTQGTTQDAAQDAAQIAAQGAAQHRIIAWYDDFTD